MSSLDGSVADPPNLAGIDMNVALQGNELADLLSFFGTSIPKVGNYQGQATMHGSIDALRLTAIDATAGRPGQRLRASGQIDDVLHWQGLALAITASVNDSQAAGRLFGVDAATPAGMACHDAPQWPAGWLRVRRSQARTRPDVGAGARRVRLRRAATTRDGETERAAGRPLRAGASSHRSPARQRQARRARRSRPMSTRTSASIAWCCPTGARSVP